jgi:hypothetical protein
LGRSSGHSDGVQASHLLVCGVMQSNTRANARSGPSVIEEQLGRLSEVIGVVVGTEDIEG